MIGIKAIIFDLDDTLYDQEQIRDTAREQSVKAMIEKGLNCSIEEACRKLKEITSRTHVIERYKELIRYFGCYGDAIAEVGRQKYNNADFDGLEIYPEVTGVLGDLKRKGMRLILVTEGSLIQQNKKINALGIRSYFNKIYISEGDKSEYFKDILKTNNFGVDEVLIIGDRIDKEISVGNKLGLKTVRILKGVYSNRVPESNLEKPDFEIRNLREIFEVIDKINRGDNNLYNNQGDNPVRGTNPSSLNLSDTNNYAEKPSRAGFGAKDSGIKIVTIGGGTGTSALLEGLKEYTDNITTIVTVTDSGRSTGMIRRELDMPAPGDARNCLLALADSEKGLYDLFQYRFDEGAFEGYSFGNLFIAALTKLNNGSFEKALEEASRILNLKGNVLPATFDNVNICAELEDGNVLEEEDKIIDRHNNYVHLRPKIKRVFHNPEGHVNEKAIQKIEEADLIIFSPGSLFTSIISNLVVKGIPEAINRSKAKKVYVCNIMTQVSQTYGFKASDHVSQILNYLGEGSGLDVVVLNKEKPSEELLESYKKENAFLVENDCEKLEKLGVRILLGDFLDDVEEKKLLWEKKDLLRHNPQKIADLLVGLVD